MFTWKVAGKIAKNKKPCPLREASDPSLPILGRRSESMICGERILFKNYLFPTTS
jgi:hypothetical protein